MFSKTVPPSLFFSEYRRSFLTVKRPEHEIDHSPSPSAEVKNEWSFTSARPVFVHYLDSNNFTLFSTPLYSNPLF